VSCRTGHDPDQLFVGKKKIPSWGSSCVVPRFCLNTARPRTNRFRAGIPERKDVGGLDPGVDDSWTTLGSLLTESREGIRAHTGTSPPARPPEKKKKKKKKKKKTKKKKKKKNKKKKIKKKKKKKKKPKKKKKTKKKKKKKKKPENKKKKQTRIGLCRRWRRKSACNPRQTENDRLPSE
jgi:hypothetical protein